MPNSCQSFLRANIAPPATGAALGGFRQKNKMTASPAMTGLLLLSYRSQNPLILEVVGKHIGNARTTGVGTLSLIDKTAY